MAEVLEAGREFELKRAVTLELTADRYGNPGAFVFATPMLVALLEETAIGCVAPALEPGAGTVGTRIDVEHKAPTPVGLTVTARVRLIEVDRRRLVFQVEARRRPRADRSRPAARQVTEAEPCLLIGTRRGKSERA